MNEYMVTIQLPEQPNAEFISLIPTQREHVNELIQRGLLLSYSLSQNREILWVVILASSRNLPCVFSRQCRCFRICNMPLRS